MFHLQIIMALNADILSLNAILSFRNLKNYSVFLRYFILFKESFLILKKFFSFLNFYKN